MPEGIIICVERFGSPGRSVPAVWARNTTPHPLHKRYHQLTSFLMSEFSYTVFFEPAEEGGFVVTCPALPGLVTEGDTLEEARIMAQDAMRGYLESLRKDQLPIPPDTIPLSEEVHVLMPEPV